VNKRWVIAEPNPALAEELATALELPVAVARVLVGRGFREAEATRRFLNPQLRQLGDPFALPDMTAAADRVLAAIARRERIVIYGDYDVDGVTSSALLTRVLKAAGGEVANFLPHRMDEGYGLSADGIARCRQEHRPQLLIAVDCGTTAVAEISNLKSQGVDVIVLDHHEPSDRLPECVAVVNTKRAGGEPFASVGVAFKLAHALLKREPGLQERIDLREHLDLVAVGTVADMVPLTGENRIFVKAGLERLPQSRKTGLRALMDIADVPVKVTPNHIGFRIGPRLNAAGRLSDAMASLELLLTEDTGQAGELAKLLHEHNADRQEIEAEIVEEALVQAAKCTGDRVGVLANPEWQSGVIGIVASRVVQAFYRPTVVIGTDGKGSCRSVAGFSMVAALTQCAPVLVRFGGHEMAAGLSVLPEKVGELRSALNAVAAGMLREEDLTPRLAIDAVVSLAEMDEEFVGALERLEPCGQENPSPLFAARGCRLRGAAREVGKGHLKFQVTEGGTTADAIWFGGAATGLPAGAMDVAFVPEMNEFRGTRTVQLRIRDVRPSI
jgi:single-stranded-DNA-specific exonuclease